MSYSKTAILLLAQCLWKHQLSGSCVQAGTHAKQQGEEQGKEQGNAVKTMLAVWKQGQAMSKQAAWGMCHWSENPLSDSYAMAKPFSGP